MHDTRKGKYTDKENEQIITAINQGLKEGTPEREILKELSYSLNRGYAGIMSHVRKLRSEYPDRFYYSDDNKKHNGRLNSWVEEEEELVIHTVNNFLEEGQPLSSAISELERRLSRTPGAIYQRIYTLRRKHPEKFKKLPAKRPRKRKNHIHWQVQRPNIRPIDEYTPHEEASLLDEEELKTKIRSLTPIHNSPTDLISGEDELMVYQAFEERFGRPHQGMKHKLMQLIRRYGPTRVSISLLTITEDREFPNLLIHFLEKRLQQ